MEKFVLVHGSWHGPWCWRLIVEKLRAAGHLVETPQLQMVGPDEAGLELIDLDTYVDAVLDAARRLGGNVTVVGHSMSGAVVQFAVEREPMLFHRSVFLAAFVLQNGETIAQQLLGNGSSILSESRHRSVSGKSTRIDPDKATDLLYAQADPVAATDAISRLRWQPTFISHMPMATSQNYGSVPSSYIVCLQDMSIDPELQMQMATQAQIEDITQIDSDHSPMLSHPKQLTELLISLANPHTDPTRRKK